MGLVKNIGLIVGGWLAIAAVVVAIWFAGLGEALRSSPSVPYATPTGNQQADYEDCRDNGGFGPDREISC